MSAPSRIFTTSATAGEFKRAMRHQLNQFSIDHKESVRLCTAAAKELQLTNYRQAQELLRDALLSRPSCALAFKLLGDMYRALNDESSARACQRNDLPESFFIRSAETASLSGAATVNRVPVYESQRCSAPMPSGVAEQLAFKATELKSDQCFVDTVYDGLVWHDALNTLGMDKDKAVVSKHTVGCGALIETIISQYQPRRLQGRAILLGAKGAHNFYHWTTDIIPRLTILQAAGIELRSTDTIIVSKANTSFAMQLLEAVGLQSDQIIETETSTPYLQADELIVPYMQNKMGHTMGQWLPEQMKCLMGVGSIRSSDRKIFINRNPATAAGRTLSNSDAAEFFFKGQGFEVIYPETLNVQQQAQLFASAGVVAGVHGAGLANIVYCSAGTKIVEFYGAHIAPCYWLISALAGLQYFQHPCELSEDTSVSRHAAGLQLDLDSVADLLQLIDQN
ncbi:MAG: glycosyltransferase 61 family protein [Pseudomonadota bacterium]